MDTRPPSLAFRFRSSSSAIKGGIAGGLLIVAWQLWAKLTGRLQDVDAVYAGGWGIGFVIGALLLTRAHRASVRHAQALGEITVDARGVCWLRGDETVVVSFPWDRVAAAFVERRTSTIVVGVRSSEESVTSLDTYVIGDTTGYVILENFDALLDAFRRHCDVKDSSDVPEEHLRGLTRRSFLAAALFGALGGALLWANETLESTYRLRHSFPLVPASLGLLAAFYALAGFTLLRRRAPLVSPLHHPSFWTRRMPLMAAILVAINFVLVGLLGQ